MASRGKQAGFRDKPLKVILMEFRVGKNDKPVGLFP